MSQTCCTSGKDMMATGAWDCITQQMNTTNSCEWYGKYHLPEAYAMHGMQSCTKMYQVKVQCRFSSILRAQLGWPCTSGRTAKSAWPVCMEVTCYLKDLSLMMHCMLIEPCCFVKALLLKQTPCHRSWCLPLHARNAGPDA